MGNLFIATCNRQYRSFEETRNYIRQQNFKSSDDYKAWAQTQDKPENIPSNPNKIYKGKGWDGWGDFLGTGNISPKDRIYRTFEEARNYVRDLSIKSKKQWNNFVKTHDIPDDIPNCPDHIYQGKGWKGWGDWLGTGCVSNRNKEYRSFE